ncbi:adhesion G protein-coupled receptor L3-like [Palaemon carinicauda]|uniref:adhesion G protein-coupled receptor L3-like n=1 Tax=Palaemon carinicauda TaxID=392227 RepID=UPI0035B5DCA2
MTVIPRSLDISPEEREDFLVIYNDDFVHITSNILNISSTWELLHKEQAANLGGTLLQILETTGFLLAGQIKNTTHRFNSSEVQMSVFALTWNSTKDVVDLFLPDDHQATSFRLPKDFGSLLQENSTQVRLVSFSVEQRSAMRALPATRNRDMAYGTYKEMNSPLISVSAGGVGQQINFTELHDSATIRFEHSFPEAGPIYRDLFREQRPGERATPVPLKATCAYWDTQDGQWSPDGCYVINTTRDVTYCACQHLTMFAILTDIHHYVGRDRVLDTLGTVLSSISCISLFIAFGIFQFYKSIASPRVSITKQLCVALGLAHLLLLFLLDRDFLKLSESVCSVSAMALHYWLMASLFWMLAEGFHLLQTVSDVLSHASYMPAYWLLGYGVPAIVVMVTLLVSYDQGHWSCQAAYAPPHSEYCWLSTEDGYIWTFTGPLIVVTVVSNFAYLNTFNMMITLRTASTLRTNKQKTRGEQIRLWVKGSFSLNCLLGTTWVFGFLYMNTGHVFAYIFTIFNASQGLMILILHCIVNDSVREAIVNSLPDRLSKYLKKQGPSQGLRAKVVPGQESSTPVVILVRKADNTLTLRNGTPGSPPPTKSQKRKRLLGKMQQWQEAASPESRRTSLESFESTSSSSNDEGGAAEEVATPWMPDSSRYIPGFEAILECDERSPRSEQRLSFFQ